MKMYRIVKKFAWKKTQVEVFIGAKTCIYKEVWLRSYYLIEERGETHAGIIWKSCTVNYRDKEAAEKVYEYLEEHWDYIINWYKGQEKPQIEWNHSCKV